MALTALSPLSFRFRFYVLEFKIKVLHVCFKVGNILYGVYIFKVKLVLERLINFFIHSLFNKTSNPSCQAFRLNTLLVVDTECHLYFFSRFY